MQIHRLAILLGALTAIGCNDPASPDSGVVRVTLAVTGLDLDPDGYVVSVDGAPASTLPGSGSATLALDTGDHTIALEGLAANCATIGPSSHTLTVYPSGTTELAFAVGCTAATGIIEVRIVTTGPDPDTDGYQLSLDAGASKGVLPTSLTLFALVPGGSHSLGLTGSAPNCSTVGPNPLEVTVDVGGLVRDVAHVTIYVSCTAVTGVIKVTAPTTGLDYDEDGYDISLDGGQPQAVAPNGVAWFTGVPGGTHSVRFSGLAPNCVGAGSNPQEVSIEVGGAVRDTAHVSLAVTCSASTGSVRVTATTSGQSQDPAYAVRVDGGSPTTFASGSSVVISRLAPGSHSILLDDVASNCEVNDPNPADVDVTVGVTTDVAFSVTCTLEPRTSGVDVIVATTGQNQDDAFYLWICSNDDWYCYYPVWSDWVSANGTAELAFPAGTYDYFVTDIAENCSGGPGSGSFTVPSGQVTTLPLDFVCAAAGTVVVEAPTSGADVDPTYWVTVDGAYRTTINAGSSVSMTLLAGTRSIGLADIAPNCGVGGSNPILVDIAAGATSNVTFAVACLANPVLRATLVTTGPNAPGTFLVGVDKYYDYYYGWYYLYSGLIPPNGEVLIPVPQGLHTVTLDQVPANCTVTSPNNVLVNLTLGATTDVAFTVTCT